MARPRPAKGREPVVPDLVLPALRSIDATELRSLETVERVLLDGADLDGLELSGLDVAESEWRDVRLSQAELFDARFREVQLTALDAAVLSLRRTSWRGVHVGASRWGAIEAYDAEWRSVRVTGCRIRFLNLRSSTLRDVEFVDCRIDDLDLGAATVERLALRDCSIGTLSVHGARLDALDLRGAELSGVEGISSLRGAIVSESQLLELAPLLAGELGLVVD